MTEPLGKLQIFPPKTIERLQEIKNQLENIVFDIRSDLNNSQSTVAASISTLDEIIQEKHAEIDKIIQQENVLNEDLYEIIKIIKGLPADVSETILTELGKCYSDILSKLASVTSDSGK